MQEWILVKSWGCGGGSYLVLTFHVGASAILFSSDWPSVSWAEPSYHSFELNLKRYLPKSALETSKSST